MKKNIYFLSVILLFSICFFGGINTVNAEEDCSYKKMKIYMDEASKAKVKTEVYEKNFYKITISNMSENFYVEVRETGHNFFYGMDNENKSISILDGFVGGKKYTLEFYTTDAYCDDDQVLRTKIIDLNYYNSYSERDECKGIKEYVYCNEYVKREVTITEEKFVEGVKKYKEENSKKASEVEKNKKEDLTIVDKVLKIVAKYQVYLYIGLGIVVGLIVLIVFLRKKKKKKKMLRGRAK